MKLGYYYLGTLCLVSIFFTRVIASNNALGGGKAVFKQPVSDVFFKQLSTVYGSGLPLDSLYKISPLFATTVWGCPRAIQCLFNEIVDVVEVVGEEICIAVPHMFYITADRAPIHNIFWTHRDNLFFFDDSFEFSEAIPEPISYRNVNTLFNPRVVTLIIPWKDSATNKIYSVGTRFIRAPEDDTDQAFGVVLLDAEAFIAKKALIPRVDAVAYQELSPEKRQSNFVALLRLWADGSHGVVPYVWGGSSITGFVSDDEFEHTYGKFADKLVALWSHRESVAPYSGMDCSLMIFRAAQICGIPYFFKNSYTISQYLRPLQEGEVVESGDIIWYDGHVMVVSDSVHHKIIESCGYPFGFGKLHEIDLGKRLAGMHTFDDLLDEYFGARCLGSLDRDGIVRRIVEHFEIFKLSSAWN